MNIGTLPANHAKFRPNKLCLVFENQRLTWRQFNAEVNRLANALLMSGLNKGDKFATILPNSLELMTAYWAAAKTGLVIVPCSPLLQASGLVSLLRNSDTRLALVHSSFLSTFEEVEPELPDMSKDRFILTGHGAPGYPTYESFISNSPDDEPAAEDIRSSDDYNIMYTSGTTGAPKGILHTHEIRAMYCVLFANAFRMGPESVVLHAGAIVFNGAMLDLMPWMYVGGTYILHPAFDAGRVIKEIEQEGVTHIVMVPSQIISLLNHPEFGTEKLASLQMILSVGAPLLLEHKHRLNDALPGRFYELYGLTEGFVTILDREDALRKAGSVGCPPPFFEMRILADDGSECAPGVVGEICGRGPILMKGYYKRDDLTEQAIVDGWLRSGDLGYVDDEGFLFLVDRKKDMIITGGVNVYPKDIEEVLVQHPEVVEAAVFGISDEKWGETPVAAVLLNEGKKIDPKQILEWVNERVGAKYQRLSYVFILEEFPRNVAGKTLKRELRDAYLSGSKDTSCN
jgi:long-chain acyl-CoA synthetase